MCQFETDHVIQHPREICQATCRGPNSLLSWNIFCGWNLHHISVLCTFMHIELTKPMEVLSSSWRSLPHATHTLYNTILRIARNFPETRENIKILTHLFYHINLGWFSWEWSKKKFFFRKKNSKCIFCTFWLFLSFCRTASRPYTLSYINALRIIQSY